MGVNTLYKNIMAIIFLVSFSANGIATEENANAEKLFNAGLEAFEKEDYLLAVSHLEKSVKVDSSNSEYHRWLGRAYGISAKYAVWYKAAGLAIKSRKSFEKSIEIAPDNIDALLDLREFHRQAPAFVGGSKKQAKKITVELRKLGYIEPQAITN